MFEDGLSSIPMTPRIQSLVSEFVSNLTLAIQEDAADAFAAALGSSQRKGGRGRHVTTRKATGFMLPPRLNTQKRDPRVIAHLVTATLAYVKKHPGQRVEQIALGLKQPSAQLKLPIQKLLAARSLSKKGVKRATVYRAR